MQYGRLDNTKVLDQDSKEQSGVYSSPKYIFKKKQQPVYWR